MTRPAPIALVETAQLEEYPIDRDTRLDGHAFIKWHHIRWMSSKTFRRASWEVQGMARALFDLSQLQCPVGTLPDDDEDLADMLRVPQRRLRELRAMEFGPLRNWVPCLSEGERRLMHPVVLAQVRDALDRREVYKLSSEDKAEYQRIKRLREAMTSLGLGKDAVADDVLIHRMNDALKATCRGNRYTRHYQAVLLQARREGWIDERSAVLSRGL